MQTIRQSDSEVEIYALLTTYLEAVRMVQRPADLPAHLMPLPIVGIDGVRAQLGAFLIGLEVVSRRLDDRSRVTLKEALYVLRATLEHLEALRQRRHVVAGTPATSGAWLRHGTQSLAGDQVCRARPEGPGRSWLFFGPK